MIFEVEVQDEVEIHVHVHVVGECEIGSNHRFDTLSGSKKVAIRALQENHVQIRSLERGRDRFSTNCF